MSRPPRFVIADGAVREGLARVAGRELHHLRDVRRLGPGAALELIDDKGVIYTGRLAGFERNAAVVTIEGVVRDAAEKVRVILAAAMIKGPRMDFLVEKAAELGADELWPLETSRGLVRGPSADRRQRWSRLAEAAAKQSLGGSMMIAAPMTVAAMTAIVPAGTLAILCAQGGAPLGRIVRERHAPVVLVACGPEGDFDEAERVVMAADGFAGASLGPNRLRSETAALAALSILAGALAE
jgi:16S rRNA (uracil1498-N3)-methyltransferase